ncbi:5-dehydro-4-deoxy-D-glucuronate isomerase [Martelella mediterranea]|uniref:5-dehydro-4-deoxy-D-glucuronate isomerase n=1 Tax=Martelella mediterranea TaxID=293089 RepID=A0A4R3NK36_9HYPH|nr:5-dehydro-4-deoxy-D-glucuronate isomerase [Martelella mediterranea]TCT28927.1 4-deoxy-L-threo-5-hexosulose-uronate ketol-isomerase [Martelella mediterranea]
MFSETRYSTSPKDIPHFTNERLREEFLIESLFIPDQLQMVYSHIDRMIVGGYLAVEKTGDISDGSAVGTPGFFDAREMGIVNLGGTGTVVVDENTYIVEHRDVVYVGRETKSVRMSSKDPSNPAAFYMNSVPAGYPVPSALIRQADSKPVTMGDEEHANKRTLRMYIHPEVSPSCLLLMGITEPAPGSIWNTEPPHVHERRMEAYVYFNMAPEDRVMHFMGEPSQIRNIVVADRQAVLSPAWSIHMGAGTGPYCFVWGMTGENKAYNDVQPVAVKDLL